jgi:hypothetical protein
MKKKTLSVRDWKNTMKNKIADSFDIELNTINCDISYRGGTLKVDVSELFPNIENAVMGAYQNYLGGGIAGAIVGAAMFDPSELSAKEEKVFHALRERIKQYFYDLNNGGGDEYMQNEVTGKGAKNGYKRNQSLSVSAY